MKLKYFLPIIFFICVFFNSCCSMGTILEKGAENHLYILYEQQLKHNDIIKNKKLENELVINDGIYTHFWLLKLLSNNRNYALRNKDSFNNLKNTKFFSLDYFSATDSHSVIWNEDFTIYFRNGKKLNTVKILNENDSFVKQFLVPIKIKISEYQSLPIIKESEIIVTGGGIFIASIVDVSKGKVIDVKTKFWNDGVLSWE